MKHPKVIAVKNRLLIATVEVAQVSWNKHLPTPLTANEKVIVDKEQTNVGKGFIKVLHGPKGSKVVSVFSQDHFTDIKGTPL